jgi:hypothetical protein
MSLRLLRASAEEIVTLAHSDEGQANDRKADFNDGDDVRGPRVVNG